MHLATSRDVLRLTGLTADQLREWTVRRALIEPDLPSQKRGSEAKFSWQTVLLLRLAVVLRTHFHVELQPHRELLRATRKLFDGASFPALWGMSLAIYDLRRCELLSARAIVSAEEDAVLLRLNRHLEILSQGFGIAEPLIQLPLFPVLPVRSTDAVKHRRRQIKEARS